MSNRPQQRLTKVFIVPSSNRDTQPISIYRIYTSPSDGIHSSRSGALPTRQTHYHSASPLSRYAPSQVLAECELKPSLVRSSRPRRRQASISPVWKAEWMKRQLETDRNLQILTPRLMKLIDDDSDVRVDLNVCSGTSPRRLSKNQGVLGINTSHGVSRCMQELYANWKKKETLLIKSISKSTTWHRS